MHSEKFRFKKVQKEYLFKFYNFLKITHWSNVPREAITNGVLKK